MRNQLKFILVVACLMLLVQTQNSFDSFKKSMEDKVMNLANKMSEIYGGFCESAVVSNC